MPSPALAGSAVDTGRLDRFRALLAVPTVSAVEAEPGPEFGEFADLLAALYPRLHGELTREVVEGHTLLYRWRGRAQGKPTVLLAHYDVVPAESDRWAHPPFEPTLTADGRLVGRGTLDNKGSLAAILEAVEELVVAGFRPQHDVYLCLGHDEELTGRGAAAVARLLETSGVRPALVLDEGGAILEPGAVAGVDATLAVIGVSEKGHATVRLTVDAPGGHSSSPPRFPATARLARAVDRVCRARFPARLGPAGAGFVRALAPHTRGLRGLALRRLPPPLVARLLALGSDETRAMVSTTATVTQLSASPRPNVLAQQASAVVHVRIGVHSSVREAVRQLRAAVHDDGVRLEVVDPAEPSPVSPLDGPAWDALARAVAAIAPEAVLTPYVWLGATDSRHFTGICDAVYRFTPFRMDAAARASLHASDESIGVDSWLAGIFFYRLVLEGR